MLKERKEYTAVYLMEESQEDLGLLRLLLKQKSVRPIKPLKVRAKTTNSIAVVKTPPPMLAIKPIPGSIKSSPVLKKALLPINSKELRLRPMSTNNGVFPLAPRAITMTTPPPIGVKQPPGVLPPIKSSGSQRMLNREPVTLSYDKNLSPAEKKCVVFRVATHVQKGRDGSRKPMGKVKKTTIVCVRKESDGNGTTKEIVSNYERKGFANARSYHAKIIPEAPNTSPEPQPAQCRAIAEYDAGLVENRAIAEYDAGLVENYYNGPYDYDNEDFEIPPHMKHPGHVKALIAPPSTPNQHEERQVRPSSSYGRRRTVLSSKRSRPLPKSSTSHCGDTHSDCPEPTSHIMASRQTPVPIYSANSPEPPIYVQPFAETPPPRLKALTVAPMSKQNSEVDQPIPQPMPSTSLSRSGTIHDNLTRVLAEPDNSSTNDTEDIPPHMRDLLNALPAQTQAFPDKQISKALAKPQPYPWHSTQTDNVNSVMVKSGRRRRHNLRVAQIDHSKFAGGIANTKHLNTENEEPEEQRAVILNKSVFPLTSLGSTGPKLHRSISALYKGLYEDPNTKVLFYFLYI